MKINARSVALDTLLKIFKQKSYSNIALNNALEKSQLSPIDKALTTQIVYGTVQYKLYLEYQLKSLVKTKLKEDYLWPLLLMSAYQYFFLDKIPTASIVDEANKLAKSYSPKDSQSYRLVNGILRSLVRRGEILPEEKDAVKYMSIKYSYPQWLVKYCLDHFGKAKTISILQAGNMPSVNSIRIADMSKKDEILHKLATEYKISISNLTNHNVNLDHGSITNSQLFKDGLITIQDSAASLVVDAFNFKGDEKVLDACSAPGGKTAQIAEYLTTGKVFALDIHQKKLNLVKQTLTRLHQDQKLIMKALDARKVNEYFFGQQFDKILVDAPCSGLGLIRRKPEVRYEKQMEDLKHLSEIQYNILDHVAGLLAENGELVYSTCTISIEENEDVVKRFLTNHPDFSLAPFEVGNLSKCKMIKIFPDDYNSDGFFIAKFVKRG